MRPKVPETPGLRHLRSQSNETVASEVKLALAFRQAAETYLSWATLGQKLRAELGAVDAMASGNGTNDPQTNEALFLIEAKFGATPEISGRPSLRRAILAVMSSEAPRVWKKSEIMQALKDHGWEPKGGKPTAQLATRLAEMIERGEITRESIGHYALAGTFHVSAALAHSAP